MVSINLLFYIWTLRQAANNICQYVSPSILKSVFHKHIHCKYSLKKVIFKPCGCNGYPAQSGVQKGSLTQGVGSREFIGIITSSAN